MTPVRWALVRAAEDPALARAAAPAGLLSDAEERVLAGLAFPARRRKWLLGRAAAKRVLEVALAARRGTAPRPAALTVANEPSGAPYALFAGERLPWAISISHRADMGLAALACEPGTAIGADLELVEPRAPGLVGDFFTDAEAAAVRAAGRRRDTVVARTWSAKEAVLKLLGVGLRADTRAIEIEELETTGDLPGWRPLAVRVALPAAPAVAAYWRDEGDHVVTLALARGGGGRVASA